MPSNSVPPNSDDDNFPAPSEANSGPSELPSDSPIDESEVYGEAQNAPIAAESEYEPGAVKKRSFPFFWVGALIGTVLGGAGLWLAAWAWIFINEDLSPRISEALTESLDRPVKLGDVENVTFGSLRVGPSEIGASTEDPTTLVADSVIVRFDLVETLLTSELRLDLTVDDAEGVLFQDEEKGWLNFEVPEAEDDEEDEKRFEVRLDDIRIRNSELTLVPLPPEGAEPEPILLNDVNGSVSIKEVTVEGEEARNTRFEIKGNPAAGGEIVVSGEVQPIAADEPAEEDIQQATNMTVQADKAPLEDILRFTLSTIDLATNQVDVTAGQVSGTLDMAFRPDEPVDYSGVLSVDDAAIDTAFLPLSFEAVEGQTRFDGDEWTIDRLSGQYGEIEAIAQGLIDFSEGYALTAEANNVSVEAFTETVDLDLPVPTAGVFDVDVQMTGAMDDPRFSGSAIATAPLQVDRLTFSSAATDFALQGSQLFLSDIAATPSTGGSLRGFGQVSLSAGSPFTFQVAGRSLPAEALASLYNVEPGFRIGLVSADARVVGGSGGVQTAIDWQSPEALYPGAGTIAIVGNSYTFTNTAFAIGGGIASGSGTLRNGVWQGDIDLQNVQLSAFSEDLEGDISGQFAVSGNTADSRIGAIAASGNVRFSNGLATFSDQFNSLSAPLTAQIAWNGEQIRIIEANTDQITASGTITPEFDRGFEGLERIDLDVVAQGYDINEIPFVTIPEPLELAGITNFNGSISGNPEAPNITGNVTVADLIVNRLPFNDRLSGTVDFAFQRGLDLNLAGATDVIALNLGPNTFRTEGATPDVDFTINWRNAIATGRTQGNILTATADNFPLSTLNFPPGGAGDIGQLRGTLTDTAVAINLDTQTVEGDITINQLGLGYLGAGQLTGKLRYANNLATLTDGSVDLNGNLYSLSGSLALGGPTPVYSASLATDRGNIQNLLTALSIYRLEDIRRGLAPPDWLVNPPSQGILDSVLATSEVIERSPSDRATFNLVQQLRRLAEIQALEVEQAITEEAEPLPPLRELKGAYAGVLQLEGTGDDFQLAFDFAGENWRWGDEYSADEVVAKGTLTPNVVTLEPVRFASVIPLPTRAATNAATSAESIEQVQSEPIEDAVEIEVVADGTGEPFDLSALESTGIDIEPALAAVTLSGQLVYGRETALTSNLQATAQNIDVESFRNIFEIPIDIDGYANASATLGGTLANPQIRGSASLDAASINDTPIEAADAQFLYQNARLNLASELTATTPEQPLTLLAQIPYAFNFMDIRPDSDAISVDINVQDEGLALLNIFTDQVAWESGTGRLNLNVGGTLSLPRVDGSAVITDAVINSPILPEPLTEVAGSAIFSDEQIIVEGLQGRFSDGQLAAAGTFPLLFPIISGPRLSRLTAPLEDSAEEAVENTELEDTGSPDAGSPDTGGPDAGSPNAEEVNPLFPQPLAPQRPLTVNLEDIALNLDGLYEGGVNGQVVVGGSALLGGPQVSGQVILSEGQVLLPDGSADSDAAVLIADSVVPLPSATNAGGISTIFRDLRLTLDSSTRIVQGNLLNFAADGTLLLNGPPSDLEAEGTINIRSGRVSLFDTIFRLRGRDNVAIFTPESGLQNPFLDISLRTSVPELRRGGFRAVESTPFATAEIAEVDQNAFSSPGSLRTVRVRADVEGPANAIFENLELSSSPPRNEDELVALLGGGFADAVRSTVGSISGSGQDDDGFSGLINLVGGSLLTRLQDVVINTLNVSEFSVFPVTAASRAQSNEDNENETGIDIGATLGFDVTENASVSFTKILTDDTDPEIGLNYRLTDALTVRGATNFDDINQFLLEYEIRF